MQNNNKVLMRHGSGSARKLVGWMFVLVLIFSTVSSTVFAGHRQGKEITKDGVLYMKNPMQPIENPVTITPDKLWQIGSDEDEVFFFGVLTQICSDSKGNIYLLDGQLNKVMIFSSSGEHIRSIGREGEGPGEFRRPSDLFLTASGNVAIMQRMPGKIVLLSPDGDPLGNYPVLDLDGGGFQMFSGGSRAGDLVVLAIQQMSRQETGMGMKLSLIGVNESGEKVATYFTQQSSRDFSNMVFDEKQSGFGSFVWKVANDGNVYISDNFDTYYIEVRRPDGSLERVIEKEYESRIRTKDEIERYAPQAMIRRHGRMSEPEVKVSKTDRDIQQIYPREDGSLWVLSSKGAFDVPDDAVAIFDVFDRDGRFANQIVVMGEGDFRRDGFHIVKDRLYVITGLRSARQSMFGGDIREAGDEEVDEEPISLICYDMSLILQTRK